MLTAFARLRDNVLAPFEAGIGLFPFVAHEIRVEQLFRGGALVIRAELPGIDPDTDVHVAISGGRLYLHVDRPQQKREQAHTEFRYGRLSRSVALPPGAILDSATARYERGLLEVTLAMGEPDRTGRLISVAVPAAPAAVSSTAPVAKRSPARARATKRSPARAASATKRPGAVTR
jgi:HSP20 family molecular chaperone IbpA